MYRHHLFALGLLLTLSLQPCHAINLTLSDLPAQLQDCVTTNGCAVAPGSSYTFGNMEAFSYIDDPTGSARTGYAIRYTLVAPSGQYSTGSGVTAYTDYLWLTVYDSYNLAMNAGRVTVYTDTVSPTPYNLLYGDSDGLDIGIDMNNAALLSGSGSELTGLDGDLNTVYVANMNLLGDQFGSALLPCLAEDCYSSAQLNLLYLLFTDNGSGSAVLSFNPADPRALLYQLETYDPYGYDPVTMDFTGVLERQSYYVSTVPLPAAVWLFAGGLVLLTMQGRRFTG